jgi:hypothetical protein
MTFKEIATRMGIPKQVERARQMSNIGAAGERRQNAKRRGD